MDEEVVEERFTTHRGRRLRFLTGGSGPALLLCHGFLGSAENFETWFGELAAVRTLIVPDLPGFGASEPLMGRHTSDALAGAVAAVADAVGAVEFDVGGLCLGASVAQSLLRRRPGAVRRLILHTPLLAPGLVRRRFHVQAAMMTAPGIFRTITWLSRRRTVSDLYKRLMVEGDDVDPRAARINFENQCRAHPRAAREWLRDGLARDDVAALRERREPTLVIAARNDRIADADALARVVAGLPLVELALVDDAGHGWTQAYVRRQLLILTRFLDAPVTART
ncbi:MAG: alpha/beta fold hydrolase [Candidatus Dormibacteria bacterium]